MARTIVAAVFGKRLDAEQAFHDLRHAGIAIDRIGVHNRDVAEDLTAFLTGLDLPAAEIQHDVEAVQTGAILLTIQADDRAAEAVDILTRHGGTDIRTRAVLSS